MGAKTVRAGDIKQIIIHDREFDPKEGSSTTFRTAGYKNESSSTGNGGISTKQNRKLGGFDSVGISLDNSKGDLEYLQEKADSGEAGNSSITLADGSTYAGDLVIQGEIDASSDGGSTEITALGVKFEKV